MKEARRLDIQQELERAQEALVQHACLPEGTTVMPCRALTYAAFHAARALLLMDRLMPKTHRGTFQKFHEHFVASGRVDVIWGKRLSRLQDDRSLADYDVGFQPDTELVHARCEDVEGFLDLTEQLLSHQEPEA